MIEPIILFFVALIIMRMLHKCVTAEEPPAAQRYQTCTKCGQIACTCNLTGICICGKIRKYTDPPCNCQQQIPLTCTNCGKTRPAKQPTCECKTPKPKKRRTLDENWSCTMDES